MPAHKVAVVVAGGLAVVVGISLLAATLAVTR